MGTRPPRSESPELDARLSEERRLSGAYLVSLGVGVILIGTLVLIHAALPARRWLYSAKTPTEVTQRELRNADDRWSVTPWARLPRLTPDYASALVAVMDSAAPVVLGDADGADSLVEETYFPLRDPSGEAVAFVRSRRFTVRRQVPTEPGDPTSFTGILDRGAMALPPRLTSEHPEFLEGTPKTEAWVLREGETPPPPRTFLPSLALGLLLVLGPVWPIARFIAHARRMAHGSRSAPV